MRCPNLSDLPAPPPGKTGWPWTEESRKLPDTMPNGDPWPRVSIITPSYNQGQFIEETIRSVLLQGYPDLEHIIMDGGSSDGSVDIIRNYERWLAHWVSAPDRGQSHAINKGFAGATGEIVAWLNSDDVYLPSAIGEAMCHFIDHRDAALVYGTTQIIDENGHVYSQSGRPGSLEELVARSNPVPQPSAFISRSALKKAGYLDEGLHLAMDRDLWIRLALRFPIGFVPQPWSQFRIHATSKSVTQEKMGWLEKLRVYLRLLEDSTFREAARAYQHKTLYSKLHYSIVELAYIGNKRGMAYRHLLSFLMLNPLELFRHKTIKLAFTIALGYRQVRTVSRWMRLGKDSQPQRGRPLVRGTPDGHFGSSWKADR